jgi:26S proteasome regulatory subunit N6
LGEDAFVQSHFAALYDSLLEKNLLRIVAPYSRIQLQYVASKISLSSHDVEVKLSQMILDKILNAIIDHSTGSLILLEEAKVDKTFALVQDCFKNMDAVVESLMIKSSQLA